MATTRSTENTSQIDSSQPQLEANESDGKVRVSQFTYTQSGAGSADDEVLLHALPAGKIRILALVFDSVTAAAGTLDLGHDGYTQPDGTAVAADATALETGVDISSGLSNDFRSFSGAAFSSRNGLTVKATYKTAGPADTDVLNGYVLYVKE